MNKFDTSLLMQIIEYSINTLRNEKPNNYISSMSTRAFIAESFVDFYGKTDPKIIDKSFSSENSYEDFILDTFSFSEERKINSYIYSILKCFCLHIYYRGRENLSKNHKDDIVKTARGVILPIIQEIMETKKQIGLEEESLKNNPEYQKLLTLIEAKEYSNLKKTGIKSVDDTMDSKLYNLLLKEKRKYEINLKTLNSTLENQKLDVWNVVNIEPAELTKKDKKELDAFIEKQEKIITEEKTGGKK